MKIITDNAVYVQREDLVHLDTNDENIPRSIAKIVCYSYHDYRQRREFLKFTQPNEIEYLKNIDWIIDYYQIKDMSCEEMEKECAEIDAMQKRIQENLYINEPIPGLEKGRYYWQGALLGLKRNALNDILMYKKGKFKLILPDGIEYPNKVSKNGKGIKKLVRTMLGRRVQ